MITALIGIGYRICNTVDTQQLLQQGIGAAKAGQRDEARQLLKRVVSVDKRNEQAWLWLSAVLDDPAQQRTCLEYVLHINPNNKQAQQGLHWITQKQARASTKTETQQPESTQVPPPNPPARKEEKPDLPPSTGRLGGESRVKVPNPATPHQKTQRTLAQRLSEAQTKKDSVATDAVHQANVGAQHAKAHATPLPQTNKRTPTTQPDISTLCPFCGAQTKHEQRTCPQCKNSLLYEYASNRNSVSLSFLGGIWGIASLFFVSLHVKLIDDDPKFFIPLFAGMVSFGIAVALLQRYRWAYFIIILGVLLLVIMPIRDYIWPFLLLFFVLIPRSYRDFYGPKKRLIPRLSQGKHQEHYDMGVQYKERGMWFLAAKEWEIAVSQQPGDATYHRALGLAYTHLKQFDKALTEFQTILSIVPDNQHAHNMIRRIEQLQEKQ